MRNRGFTELTKKTDQLSHDWNLAVKILLIIVTLIVTLITIVTF